MAESSRSLWRHDDFVKLWIAETVSQVGSQVTLLALPLVAIDVLRASTFEVALLGTIELLPFVLLGLPAGVWIDRRHRRPILLMGDLARAVALGSIPIAYYLGVLSMLQLYVVAFVVGSFTVAFDVAYEAYLPSLIEREQLVEGYSKLEVSRSGATIAGPTIAGALVALGSASLAILLDAVSFLVSGAFILLIRRREHLDVAPAAATGREQPDVWRGIWDGLRYVLGHPHMRAIAACTATSNLFLSMSTAVLLVYLVREVQIDPASLGIVFGIGNVGLLVGALAAHRAAIRIGLGPSIVLAMLVCGAAGVLIPLAPPALAPAFVAASQLISGLATTIYNINQVSLRQSIAPPHMRGRINATMRFMVWGTIPVGSFTGGLLGTSLGLLPTLWIAALGGLTAVLWVVLSPVRSLQSIPATDVDFLLDHAGRYSTTKES